MIIILLLSALTIAYYFLHITYQYWAKKGVSGPKPSFLVGNFGRAFTFKTSPGQIYAEIYNEFKNEDVIGLYRATTPVLLIRSPELVKEVTVKSFNHFQDNDVILEKETDPLLGRNPFALKGEEWKTTRAKLTPAFTSGKMKSLYPLLEHVCEGLVKFIENQPDAINGQGYDAKEICTRFTLNNVATCAFGLEGKCFEEENSHFRQLARQFFSPGSWSVLVFHLFTVYPSLGRVLKLRFVSKSLEKKLIDMVSQTLKYRQENNVIRHDFLHIINQLKDTHKDITDLDVTAHAVSFFGDAYETSSGVLSFVLFELANNQEVQTKLRAELDSVFEENDGKIPYEALQNCHYLDAVLNETLRCHPPLMHLQKVCTKDFTFSLKNSKPLTLVKGTPVILPIYGLQHDPAYFENPEDFNPERFLEPNKDNLVKYTFLPLGEGPRSCLGQRFGFLQIKIGIAYIVKSFEIFVNKKTQLPIKYDPMNALTYPIGGFWLDFKKISY